MARNLSRNTRLFVSTIAPASFGATSCDDTNTWEVKVLDGYSFSQDVANTEIGVSESASECATGGLARGTLGFNTALNPVEVSFSTYVRPFDNGATGDCVEKALWGAALAGDTAFAASPATSATAVWNETTGPDAITFVCDHSDVNELQLLYLYFVLDTTTYVIDEFSVGTAEVDFSIDGIATINWSGSGTAVNENENVHNVITDDTDGDYLDPTTPDYQLVPATTSTSFLRNKLSTIELTDNQLLGTPHDADTFGSETGGVITLGGTLGNTGDYVNGRVHNVDSDEWATILTDAGTTVTISAADHALVGNATNWNASDVLNFYTAAQHAAVSYCIPITGGTLTLENNMSYLTPEELAIVNQPLAGFTGNRVVSGSVTAYLNTGAMGTGGLLQDLLSKVTEVNNDFTLVFHMGGTSTEFPRVDFTIPHAQVGIPSTNVEDVISTEITFNAQPWTGTAASFEGANDMTIAYVSSAP